MGFLVETGVPFGNACDVAVEMEGDRSRVCFAADPHGGPESLWFCFRLRRAGGAPGGQVRLVLRHFETMLGGNRPDAIRPVVRAGSGEWERLGPGEEGALPDGRAEVGWTVAAPEEYLDVALCYPYGRPELDALLQDLCGRGGGWRADSIGVSQGGRPLVRVSNGPGEPDGRRPGVYLMARQHSGETPGSWVLDGFLREAASRGPDAPLVWAVPLANIDGVEAGDYGKDNFPYDLNRAWGQPPMRHEALVFQRDLKRWQERCRPALCLDFHAPGGSEREGIYFFLPDPELFSRQHRRALDWAERCEAALGPAYAAAPFGRVATYASRWATPTFTAYCCGTLDVCGITLEIPYAMAGDTLLTRERYREAGARLAECVCRELAA